MSKIARSRKPKRASGARRPGKDAGSGFRLVGSIDSVLSGRVPADTGDPVREAALQTATEYLRRLPTLHLVSIIPVLVKYAVGNALTDPGRPPGG